MSMTIEQFQRILMQVRDELLQEMRDMPASELRTTVCIPVRKSRINARYINAGWCGTFSSKVHELAPECEERETEWEKDDPTHEFLIFKGKCYDAQCIEGVDHYQDLPSFKYWTGWDGQGYTKDKTKPALGYEL